MIKVLEEAIEKVRGLSEEQQRYAAHIPEQIVSADKVYHLIDVERRLVREGLADLDHRTDRLQRRHGGLLAAQSCMKVACVELARQDIAAIYDYSALSNVQAAQALQNAVRSATNPCLNRCQSHSNRCAFIWGCLDRRCFTWRRRFIGAII